jgi:protein-S-isoprenylcysteine O-methyltransferase Ste14
MTRPAPGAGPLGRLFAWLGGGLFAASLLYFLYAYFVRFSRVAPEGTALATPLVLDAALFSIFALHHSVLARSGAKERIARLVSPPLERTVYVWVSSALFLICCSAWRELPGIVYQLPRSLSPAGLLVQAAGVWLTLHAARTLDLLDLAGVRQALGKPLALPLQATGAYRLVRHPIYLGWLLMTFGAPSMTATRFWFACVSGFYLIIAIPFEERSLAREFGRAYDEYRRKVRWRMVPGVY